MIPDTLVLAMADSIRVLGHASPHLMAQMIAFKWLMFFIGFLGVVWRLLEKCPKNDWAGIKAYLAASVKDIILASIIYIAIYLAWASAAGWIKGWAWAQSFLFLFDYRVASLSIILAYFSKKLIRGAEKGLTDKGVLVDDAPPTPQP